MTSQSSVLECPADLAEALREAEEPNTVDCAFFTQDGRMVSSVDMLNLIEDSAVNKSVTSKLQKVQKSLDGSTQSEAELRQSLLVSGTAYLATDQVVEPPYPAQIMQDFLELEETNYRASRTKATDSVLRGYQLKSSVPIRLDEQETSTLDSDKTDDVHAPRSSVKVSEYNKELVEVEEFIAGCNDMAGFEGVLEMVAMDFEAIGWAAIEVTRSFDKKIKGIAHIPAGRIKPLVGFKGFVEEVFDVNHHKRYYVPFGSKVVHVTRTQLIGDIVEPYEPRKHGPITGPDVEWRLTDALTGQPTESLAMSANEVIWIKNHHPNTIYYGYADVIPALGAVAGNIKIRNYFLQFFEHNTVPRFAVIVEGAKMTTEVMQMIDAYFKTEVKNNRHGTLILAVPSMRGEVRVRFEKLDTDQKEGDFLKTGDYNVKAILIAHGTSPAIIGITEAPELGSGKGLSQAEIYRDRIVIPRQRKYAGILNLLFRKGLGVTLVVFEFNPLDIKDRESESRIHSAYLDRGGVSLNEVRADQGRPPIKGGDRIFVRSRGGQIVFVDHFNKAGAIIDPTDEGESGSSGESNVESDTSSTENPNNQGSGDNNTP